MLHVADKKVIDGVVSAVSLSLAKQQRSAERRISAAQQAAQKAAEEQALRVANLNELLDTVERGLVNVAELLNEPSINHLLATLWEDGKKEFVLYAVSNSDGVVVSLRPGIVAVTVDGLRVSCVQAAGSSNVRYTKCTLGADFPYCGPYWSARAFFGDLIINELDHDYWHDSSYRVEDGSRMESWGWLIQDRFVKSATKVTSHQLGRFHNFTSLGLEADTKKHLRSLEQFRDDPDVGHWKDWGEMGVDIAHIPARFFYDCADPQVLGKHLSVALRKM